MFSFSLFHSGFMPAYKWEIGHLDFESFVKKVSLIVKREIILLSERMSPFRARWNSWMKKSINQNWKWRWNVTCIFTMRYIFEKWAVLLQISVLCHISTDWTRKRNLTIFPKVMGCFLACARAEKATENYGASSLILLNLMHLAISKSIHDQGAPSDWKFRLVNLGWNLPPSDPILRLVYTGGLKMKQGGQIVLTTENLKVHLVGEEKERVGCFPVILIL